MFSWKLSDDVAGITHLALKDVRNQARRAQGQVIEGPTGGLRFIGYIVFDV